MSEIIKKSSLKKDALYVYVGYILRYLSVLVLVPYYGRVLGPANYGKVLAAMSLMGLVWMVVNYGFSIVGSRELSSTQERLSHGPIFGRQIAGRLILMPIGIAIGILGTIISPILSADPWFGAIGTVLGVIAAMNLGWFFQGLRKFKVSLFCEAISYPLNVIFVLLLVKNDGDGLFALIGLLLSSSLSSAITYIIALRHLELRSISLKGGIQEIKSAGTIFIQNINSMLMTSGSTYLLSILSSPEQVGYFGSVEKLVSFALAFLAPAGQVLMPTIAHRTKHAPHDVPKLVQKGIIFEISYGMCALMGGLALAPIIIPLAFGPKFEASVILMRIMVCALPFAAFTHAFGLYVLIPQKKEVRLVTAVTIGNFVNLALIGMLSHNLGGKGVAIARVAGEGLTAAILSFMAFNQSNAIFSLARNKS